MGLFQTDGAGRHRLRLLALFAVLQPGTPKTKSWTNAKPEDPVGDDKLEDDLTQAVDELRKRVKEEARQHKLGVALITNPHEIEIAKLTVPIWRAYCEHNKLGFFVQKDVLNTHLLPEWSKPRTLMELLPVTRWKYVLMVDARSLPVGFNRSFSFAIKQHMRHKRFPNDEAWDRLIYCPQDCEEEYEDTVSDGKCYGPILSGCLFQANKRQTARLVRYWYAKRRLENATQDQAIAKAWQEMKNSNWTKVFMHDIQQDIGKKTSGFVAQFTYDTKYKWNIRDQIYDFILAHPDLAKIGNETFEETRKEEL